WYAVARKVVRRSDHRHAACAKLARDEARVAKGADTNRDIGPFLHEIDDRIREHDVDRHLGMEREKGWQERHHTAHAEWNVAVDRQVSARARARRRLALGLSMLARILTARS